MLTTINYYIILSILILIVTGKWLKINKNTDEETNKAKKA